MKMVWYKNSKKIITTSVLFVESWAIIILSCPESKL